MNYKCEICKYGPTIKRNYDRHMKTKKHINNEKEHKQSTRRKFNCLNCDCTFVTQSGINRHLKVCANMIIAEKEKVHNDIVQELKFKIEETEKVHKENISDFELELMKKDMQIELMSKDINSLRELIKIKDESNKELLKIKDESNKKIEHILENENEYHKTLVDRTSDMVKTSMSALKFAKKNYPNAPALLKYDNMDAIKLDKEYGVGATMIWHDENHTIAKAIGGIILKQYKKEDPAYQSLWNSDFTRIAYIIMDDVNNKKEWVVDKGGVRVQELLVDPILNHLRGKLIKRSVRKAQQMAKDFHHPEKYITIMNQCNILIKKIDNGTIAGKVMRYLSKFLHIGNKMKAIEE